MLYYSNHLPGPVLPLSAAFAAAGCHYLSSPPLSAAAAFLGGFCPAAEPLPSAPGTLCPSAPAAPGSEDQNKPFNPDSIEPCFNHAILCQR